MIPVKIQCACGQRYAFEVEPILGQMPSTVACPVCGADGTAHANAYIAQNAAPPSAVAVAPVRVAAARVAVAAPPIAAPPIAAPPPGPTLAARNAAAYTTPLEPAQIETEARAKILWGDEPDEVIKYLVIKGADPDEAAAVVHAMLKERASAIRGNGVRKMGLGALLVCVPVGTLITFAKMGVVSFTILGIAGAVGLWGGWMIFQGIFMLLAPKSEAGDVSEQ